MSEAGSGVGLALSGGGYRAMLFHVGALIRLNEAGMLPKLTQVSSVSGGSITAAVLALAWKELAFDGGVAARFGTVVDRVRRLADRTIDVGAVIGGLLLPGTIGRRIAQAYDRVLFHGATLQDLPDDTSGQAPYFVINATSLQTGDLWRFARPYMADYRVGLFRSPRVRLCDAVAASSAFPPILSPFILPIGEPVESVNGADLGRLPYTARAVLGDGGIYDNLGLETLKECRTLLVSDGGQKIAPAEAPHRDWARQSIRVMSVIDNQVRSLRKRELIASYQRDEVDGGYWGIRTHYADYGLAEDPLGAAGRDPSPLAGLPTRLKALPRALQDRLMNWGYAVSDAALRAHVGKALQDRLGISLAAPKGFPFPGGY